MSQGNLREKPKRPGFPSDLQSFQGRPQTPRQCPSDRDTGIPTKGHWALYMDSDHLCRETGIQEEKPLGSQGNHGIAGTWSMVLQSDENLFRMLPRGVVSKNLGGKKNHFLLI